jgi:microcystin-dependent protein
MSQPFIGEIRMFSGNFEPTGWMPCDGRLLPISEHLALYEVLGTTHGGDGRTNFALPDLRGQVRTVFGNAVKFIIATVGESARDEVRIMRNFGVLKQR